MGAILSIKAGVNQRKRNIGQFFTAGKPVRTEIKIPSTPDLDLRGDFRITSRYLADISGGTKCKARNGIPEPCCRYPEAIG
jgi:hypothetical protein